MLIYGATGKAGRLVMERALERGWAVVAFVRNPDKVPEALRAKVTVIKGDLCDAAAVSAAVARRGPTPSWTHRARSVGSREGPAGQQRGPFDLHEGNGGGARGRGAAGRLRDGHHRRSASARAWGDDRKVVGGGDGLGDSERRRAEGLGGGRGLGPLCFEGAPPAFRFVYTRLGQMVEHPPAARCARSPRRTTSSMAARHTATSPTRS